MGAGSPVTAAAADTLEPPVLAVDESTLRALASNGPLVQQSVASLDAARAARRGAWTNYLPAVTASYFCYGYVAWIFFSWFYRYLAKVRGLDLKSSAFYSMLPFLAMLVCCLVGGTINDRLTKWRGPRLGRCGLAAFSMLVAGIFIAFGSQVQGVRLASVVLAGGAGALYLSQSSFWSVTADIAGASAGSVSGFMNMGAQIGGALTGSLTPWIAVRYGWTASFLVAAALCVVGAVSWLAVDPVQTLTGERTSAELDQVHT